MLSDEEKKEYEELKSLLYTGTISQYGKRKLIDMFEKQQKEIEELKKNNETQPDCAEPIERTEEMVNMRWVNHNYILKTESEQRERKAYIKGTNDADELCNKKWEDKIKAKIEEYKKQIEKMEKDDIGIGFTLGKEWSDLKAKIEFGQSLLEKE